MAPLFFLFTLLPFLELFLLIRIGRTFGALNTLVYLLLMGLLGAYLAKRQGRKVVSEARAALEQGRVPDESLLAGALSTLGAALLIAPGPITDALGLSCLLPPSRRLIASALKRGLAKRVEQGRIHVQSTGFPFPSDPFSARRPPPVRGDIIDTEGEDVTDKDRNVLK